MRPSVAASERGVNLGLIFTRTSCKSSCTDEANSRIWGGIHYRFDIDASQVSCPQVADYLFDNYMRPTR